MTCLFSHFEQSQSRLYSSLQTAFSCALVSLSTYYDGHVFLFACSLAEPEQTSRSKPVAPPVAHAPADNLPVSCTCAKGPPSPLFKGSSVRDGCAHKQQVARFEWESILPRRLLIGCWWRYIFNLALIEQANIVPRKPLDEASHGGYIESGRVAREIKSAQQMSEIERSNNRKTKTKAPRTTSIGPPSDNNNNNSSNNTS